MTINKHYQKRYLFQNWKELCERVSRTIANSDTGFEKAIYNAMLAKSFLPAGNTLVAGSKPIAPNCSILGLLTDDNFNDMLELSCKLWRQGTGVGYDLSGLGHPAQALKILSDANNAIDLGHRPKRGNMAVLSAEHPEIIEFICCKTRNDDLYNFNISVLYSESLRDNDVLLETIARQAHATGDPGLIFIDKGRQYGPVDASDSLGKVTTCVPCGEQFMHAYETCNLGSINLNSDALMDASRVYIDEQKLCKTARLAVDVLDRVIDLLVFPDDKIREVSLAARRIGLGVTGWADYLERINLNYNSREARELAKRVSRLITESAEQRSRELAKELGPCKFSREYRNISLTCIAPTGGITGLMQLKGYAVEPYFEQAVDSDYRAHIDMQSAWQSGIHNAVSKTINLSSEATVQTVMDAYKYAADSDCKGITIYRDQSKFNQPRVLVCDQCEIAPDV